jgi:DNA-binding beta-propeller fold protein YncE
MMDTDQGVNKIFGTGEHRFRVVAGWGMGPEGRVPGGRVCSVATDSRDRVFVFVRAPTPVLIYDREGRFLSGWGEGIFTEPHGIWIAPDDSVFLVDRKDHTVRKFTPDGRLLAIWGTPGEPGKTFNTPQKAILAPDGEMYVADHLNYQVHRYAPDGTWIAAWGRQGTGPGEFAYPHSLVIDRRNRVLVTDRENNRVQIFDRGGQYLTEWAVPKAQGIVMASDGSIYVLVEEKRRVDIFSEDGEIVCQWGERGKQPEQFRNFLHDCCLDSRGDIYLCGIMIDDMLQKFERV